MANKHNSARGMAWWISNFFFVVGLALIIGAWWVARDTVDLLKTGVPARGVVVKLVENRDSDGGSTYAPMVEVTSREHGVFQFTSSVSSSPPSFSVGEKVEVIVDPEDRERAVINSFFQKWFGSTLLTVMGGVFSLMGLLSMRFMKRSKKKGRGGTDI